MIEWLAVMFPLVFSPGPANIVAAISGVQVGLRQSIPLFAGINIVYFLYSVLAGVGVGELLRTFPDLLLVMRYGGAAYIIWLGISMWRRSKSRNAASRFGLKDGIAIQALNPKFPIILISMYSIFLVAEERLLPQVLLLSISILTLNVFTQLVWGGTGALLGRSLTSERSALLQDRVFAVLLAAVGVWIALRTNLPIN